MLDATSPVEAYAGRVIDGQHPAQTHSKEDRGYLRNVYPFSAFPSVLKYWQRLESRPSVARVLAEAAPHFQAMMAAG